METPGCQLRAETQGTSAQSPGGTPWFVASPRSQARSCPYLDMCPDADPWQKHTLHQTSAVICCARTARCEGGGVRFRAFFIVCSPVAGCGSPGKDQAPRTHDPTTAIPTRDTSASGACFTSDACILRAPRLCDAAVGQPFEKRQRGNGGSRPHGCSLKAPVCLFHPALLVPLPTPTMTVALRRALNDTQYCTAKHSTVQYSTGRAFGSDTTQAGPRDFSALSKLSTLPVTLRPALFCASAPPRISTTQEASAYPNGVIEWLLNAPSSTQ
jgi:hypothetical protein